MCSSDLDVFGDNHVAPLVLVCIKMPIVYSSQERRQDMTVPKVWSSHIRSKHEMNPGLVLDTINIGILFVLLLVTDFTSPMHPRFIRLGDSNVFRLAGKVWFDGVFHMSIIGILKVL